jgi:hypothetical protein
MKPKASTRQYPHQPHWGAFLCLRPPVLVALVLWWNGMLLAGAWLNGGLKPIKDERAQILFVVCVSVVSAFMWLLAFNDSFIQSVVAPERASRYHRPSFVLAGVVTALIAGISSFGLFSK